MTSTDGATAERTTIEGILEFVELEGGFWRLQPDDGDLVVLGTPDELADARSGQRARVIGSHADDGATMFMAGPPFAVDSIELLEEGFSINVFQMVGLAVLLLVLLAGIAVGTYLLLKPGSQGDVMACKTGQPAKGAPYVDGLVLKAQSGAFELTTRQGKRMTLLIRVPDRPYLDVQHAKSHAALGQPVRITTKKVEGKTYAVCLEDSPLIF